MESEDYAENADNPDFEAGMQNLSLKDLGIKKLETETKPNPNLSASEKYIIENKTKYIQIHEDLDSCEDITTKLLNMTEELKQGQMIHTDDFTLEETMNSVELDHFKMDSHYNFKAALTYKRLLREGRIKNIKDLNLTETLSLIDNLFILETMWKYGHPIYQTIFNLVYFSDDAVIAEGAKYVSGTLENIFRIYLDSTLHIIYLTFSSIIDCSCLREEDVMMIPIQNVNVFKRDPASILEQLRMIEKDLKNKIKDEKQIDQDSILIINALLSRIKLRIYLFTLIKEQFDFSYKKRYSNLLTLANTMKNVFGEIKNYPQENLLCMTDVYFCDQLCRISPTISSIKVINKLNYKESIDKMQVFIENIISCSSIYDTSLTDWSQLPKAMDGINSQSPSFIIRAMLELNLFPKDGKLLGTIDYKNLLYKVLTTEFKVSNFDEKSDFMNNFFNVQKEILIKNLRNRPRQVRDSSSLFEGLIYLVFESNQIEKQEKLEKQNKKSHNKFLPVLTNYNLRLLLLEMINHIFISFEIELFSSFELDYVFFLAGTVLEQVCTSNNIITRSFAEKILKEDDMAKSTLKKKLTPIQKTTMDEIYIMNALRCAIKGLAIMCRYLKVSGLIKSPESKEGEKLRISNRFPSFKNCKYFLDMSYENFVRETTFDVLNEKDMILASADSYLKQSLKYLNELKSADLKLRDGFHYSNTYIENLSKSIISNNLFLSKIRKTDNKGLPLKVVYIKKYETFLPVLELSS
jgi:hypothetical protein